MAPLPIISGAFVHRLADDNKEFVARIHHQTLVNPAKNRKKVKKSPSNDKTHSNIGTFDCGPNQVEKESQSGCTACQNNAAAKFSGASFARVSCG